MSLHASSALKRYHRVHFSIRDTAYWGDAPSMPDHRHALYLTPFSYQWRLFAIRSAYERTQSFASHMFLQAIASALGKQLYPGTTGQNRTAIASYQPLADLSPPRTFSRFNAVLPLYDRGIKR